MEYEDGNAAIHVYEPGAKEPRYVPITVARERLRQPFPVDLDVTSLTMRPAQRRR